MNDTENQQVPYSMLAQLLEQNAELIKRLTMNLEGGANQSSANFNVVPDLHKSIRKFSGKENEGAAASWFESIQGMSELHGWSDSFRLELVRSNLIEGASDWFYSLSVRTWREFETEFKNTFMGRETVAEQWSTLLNYKQTKYEDVFDYYFAKKRLCDNLKLPFAETKSQVMQGLYDRELKTFLLCKTHLDSNTLLADIREFKRTMGVPIKDRVMVQSKQIKQEGPKEPSPRVKDSEDVTCFRCNMKGHIRKNCTSPLVCQKCNKQGHTRKNCFVNEGSIKKEHTNVQLKNCAVAKNDDEPVVMNEKYFFDAEINGNLVNSYVDFGSQCVMMTKSKANELGFKLNVAPPDSSMIRGVGSGMAQTLGVFEATLRVDQATADIVVHVVDDSIIDIPLLIGQPFTEQPHIIYYKKGDHLRIFEQIHLPENSLDRIEIPNLPKLKTSLWVKEATVLPPNHVGFIAVTTGVVADEVHDIFIDSTTNRNGCIIPACVINGNADGLAVPILNCTTSDIVFKEGERVTKAELCIFDESKSGKEKSDGDEEKFEDLIDINPEISDEYKAKLLDLLQQYRACFALNINELGCGVNTEFSVDLTDKTPITYKPYRLSESERAFVRNEMKLLKDAGIIIDSESDYASPILIVRKKNGDKRICIDYRALNRVTRKSKYPLPIIEDQINRLHGMKYFNVLDMRSGYYQVKVAEDSRHVTAFVTPDGHYEFLRMPFGVANGPAVFQKLINSALGHLRFTIAMSYFDDILIPASSINECIENLETVLKALGRADLKLNIRKCKFLMTTIEYLGYEISDGVISPSHLKTNAVLNFKRPSNAHEVRQFIGLTSYFRKFIENYAILARPLTHLTKKEVVWKWTDIEENAYNALKKKLTEKPVLSIYCKDDETEVHTDACKDGLAGVILQKKSDGKFHPIAYASRQTTKEESRYHSTELEALAVVWVLERFRVYLVGIPFVIKTDCNAVRSSMSKKDILPRIGRWWLKLSEYNFEIIHTPGTENKHADALSRNPTDSPEITNPVGDICVLHSSLDTSDWVKLLQETDRKIIYIKETLQKKFELSIDEKRIQNEFAVENGRVYKLEGSKKLLHIPDGARYKIVQSCHDDMGHIGVDKVVSKIREKYWFPRLRNYVKRFIGACFECLYHKQPAGKKQGFLHPIDKVGIPFHTLHVDHLGPFVRGRYGNMYILVIIDGFTKFCILKPVRNVKSETTVRALTEVISVFGAPTRIISDRGTAFTGSPFRKFCSDKDIVHILNATATPRANGQCERLNRTITPMLATLCKKPNGSDWDRHTGLVQWSVNNSYHHVLKTTPFSLLFSYNPRRLKTNKLDDVIENTNEDDVITLRQKAIDHIRTNQEHQRQQFNKRRCAAQTYVPGDSVMVRRDPASTGGSLKLLPLYKGPYVVTEVLPHDRYRIADLPDAQRTQRFYEGVVPAEDMKRVLTPPDDIGSDSSTDHDNSQPKRPTRVKTTPGYLKDYVM